MYIDTHAHLNFEAFKNDYRQVIECAFGNNIGAIINVGSNFETSKKAIEITNQYPEDIYAAIGLHPIHVKDVCPERSRGEEFDEAIFTKLAKQKKVVALGETGLDFYYDKSNAERQKEVFRKMLKMSQVVSKPIILHSREAGDDVLSILIEQRPEPRGVMHCFQGDWPYAKMILDMGLLISFTGLITFSKDQKTLEVIKNAPLEQIMIETDCPFMTPEPYRGQRNEPSFVIEIAKKIAEIKKIPLEKVAEQTSKNAIKLFGLKF